jgi:hypothetical protein
VVVFPFAFHTAVQQPFKPLWSRLLLYELEPSRASFALCFKSLLMTLLPASVFAVSQVGTYICTKVPGEFPAFIFVVGWKVEAETPLHRIPGVWTFNSMPL